MHLIVIALRFEIEHRDNIEYCYNAKHQVPPQYAFVFPGSQRRL